MIVPEDLSVKTIGITGADGLLGWQLQCHLRALRPKFNVLPANRKLFENKERLVELFGQCDAVVHLAGMNRGDDSVVEETNVALANTVVDALKQCGRTPHLIFSSSTHSVGDTAYGRSKRRASEVLGAWAENTNARFSNLILPHVFGECGRPFYNSVVSTFCHQLANKEQVVVMQDSELELLHAQDVARLILRAIEDETSGDVRPSGTSMRVSELRERLERFSREYGDGIIPDLRESIDLQLFNTYRSYLFPNAYPVPLELRSDDRGSLIEAVKSEHGGQAFMSTTKPGLTRGEHYHLGKIERFLVMNGSAVIRVRRLFDKHIHEFHVNGDNPAYIDMPTFHTHNITNTGDAELLTLFWSNEIFDPECPDTYAESVSNGKTSQ